METSSGPRHATTPLLTKSKKLALRRPQLNGTLRGKTTTPAGNNILTISTDNLLLVTVTVSSTATITRDGEISSFEALQVGERIVSGGYDPIKLGHPTRMLNPLVSFEPPGPCRIWTKCSSP